MKIISKFDYSRVLYSKQNNLNLLIQAIAPKVIVKEDKRKPLNIITCIDVSTSMTGAKLDYAKKSLLKLIDHLSPNDTLGIVSFSTYVNVVSEPMKMTSENKEKFKTNVNALYANSSTNFSGALFKALEMADSVDGDCRIIMFTDGQANHGVTDYKTLVGMLDGKLKKGITISNFGYGDDHVAEFLTELSKAGQGNYAYVKNPDDALTAFAIELGGLLSCYAQDLVFTVKPKGDVKIKEVISDLDVEEKDGGVNISINDIYSEEVKNIVLELEVPEQKKFFPRDTALVDVTVSYIEASSGDKKKLDSRGKVKFVSSESEVQKDIDKEVADQLAIAKLVKAQIEANKFAKAGNFDAATMTMRGVASVMGCASDATQGLYATSAAYYVDTQSFTANANNAHSMTSALRSGGRGMSGPAGVDGMSNSIQQQMVNSFVGGAQGSNQGGGTAGVVITNTGLQGNTVDLNSLINSSLTASNEKPLKKKRSQKEW